MPYSIKTCFSYYIGFFFFIANIYSQNDWVDYVVQKDKGIMSISIDLSYKYQRSNYKNLLIVGSNYRDCLKNGFPTPKGLEKLYAFSDSTATIIDRLTKNKLVGIITYQCYGLDVYYVKDTLNIRKDLNKMFKENFSLSNNYIHIKRDPIWYYYLVNLYPESDTNDHLADHQFLNELVLKGDDLSGKRKINHWIYFKSNSFKNDNRKLKVYDKFRGLKFSIDSLNYKGAGTYPYELQVSRKDSVNPKSIAELTYMLKNLSRSLNGRYEGWRTELKIQD